MTTLTPSAIGPRPPTTEEIRELRHQLGAPLGDPEAVDQAAIAVFDNDAIAGKFNGDKLMVVVWSSSPSDRDVYVWRQGVMEWIAPDA